MGETLLEVRNLSKTFRYRTGLFRRMNLDAVKPVSFTLREKQTLAIIGENGSGKSTTGYGILGLENITSGAVLYDGKDMQAMPPAERQKLIAREMQIVFQDPSAALNPKMTEIGRASCRERV